jgi:acyl-CoA synthetase (AMP-forming)/AMP-acid ligase II
MRNTVKELLIEAGKLWGKKQLVADAQQRWQISYDYSLELDKDYQKEAAQRKTKKLVRCFLLGSINTFFEQWLKTIIYENIIVPMNPLSSQDQIKSLLHALTPDEIFVDTRFPHVYVICDQLMTDKRIIKDISGTNIIWGWGTGTSFFNSLDDVWQIGITTGTTGSPKMVPQTHKMLLSTARLITNGYNITDKDRGLMVLPPWCVDGLVANVLSGAFVGATTFVLERFELDLFCRSININNITYSVIVPDMLQWILDKPECWKMLQTIRFFIVGGDILSRELHEEFTKKTGIPIYLDWGMTETMGWGTLHPPAKIKFGSIGIAASNETDIKIVDFETFEEVPVGQKGLMLIKGPQLFNGYLLNNDINRWHKGYFNTGDIVWKDSTRYIFFVGRLFHDIAKFKGYYVDLRLIEQELEKIDGVKTACCVVHPQIPGRRRIKAVLEVNNRAEISPSYILKELENSYQKIIPKYSKVSEISIVDQLPRTRKGRPDRVAVIEILNKKDERYN